MSIYCHLIASTRRSSVFASFIDFLFISVRDSASAFLCRLLREMSKEPKASTHIFILIAKQQHLRALLVEVLGDRIVCNPAFAIPRIKSVMIVLFVRCVDKGLLAELVLLRLPWDLLVLVLEDSSVVRHLSISEGVQCCWIIPRVMIDLSLIHGDISAILLSQEWSAINMVFSSQLQLMILDRENTAKYFTADFAKH